MSDEATNPADQFRQLATAGDEIAQKLSEGGAPNQGQIVAAMAQIVRQVAEQLDAAQPPD